jgi:hypothetical protein
MNVLVRQDTRFASDQAWSPRSSVADLTAAAWPWLRRGGWDAVWIQSALWLTPLVLLLARGGTDPREGLLDATYCWLTALLWLGHRVGSTWLAYGTTAYRPLLRAEPGRFVVAPGAIAAACFALLLPDDAALPWTRAERVVVLAVLDYLLVTHHFASQHFGVLSLYRARAGGTATRGARRLDRLYALVVGGLLVVVAEVVAGTVCFIDLWIDPWLDPDRVAAAANTIAAAATVIAIASTLAMIARDARSERPSVPRMLYLAGIGAMVAAAFQVRVPFVFVVLWTTQHWLVATGLTTLVAEHEPTPAHGGWRASLHAINRRPWLLLVVLLALSVVLLPLMEVEAVADGGTFYGDRIFGALAAALRDGPLAPALVALGFTTGFCHYWLDRAVYRLSNARVREAARGLFL